MSAASPRGGPVPPAWVRPTARLVPWPAVLGPLAAVTLLVRLLRAGELTAPPALGIAALAGVAAAVALALDDTAHELTAALPVDRRHRALQRLALVVPVAVGCWAIAASTVVPDVSRLDAVSLLVSMTSVAVAVAVLVGRARPDLAATCGAATPFAFVAVDLLGARGEGRSVLELWADHPWPVVVAAVLASVVGLRGSRFVARGSWRSGRRRRGRRGRQSPP